MAITAVTPFFCVPRKQIWPYPFLIAIERKRKLTTEEAQVATLHWHPAQDMNAANYNNNCRGAHPHPRAPLLCAPCPLLPLCVCICVNSSGTWACALAALPAPLRGNLSCFCQINQRPSVCVCGVCGVCVCKRRVWSPLWAPLECRFPHLIGHRSCAASRLLLLIDSSELALLQRCSGAWRMEIEQKCRRCNRSIERRKRRANECNSKMEFE